MIVGLGFFPFSSPVVKKGFQGKSAKERRVHAELESCLSANTHVYLMN